jgi:hypothetical protein
MSVASHPLSIIGRPSLPIRSRAAMDSHRRSLYASMVKTVRSHRAAVSAKPGVT